MLPIKTDDPFTSKVQILAFDVQVGLEHLGKPNHLHATFDSSGKLWGLPDWQPKYLHLLVFVGQMRNWRAKGWITFQDSSGKIRLKNLSSTENRGILRAPSGKVPGGTH